MRLRRHGNLRTRLLAGLVLAGCSDYGLADNKAAAAGADDTAAACSPDDFAEHPAADVAQDDACAFPGDPGSFDPQVDWQWSGSGDQDDWGDVMMMPAVGDVDADGVPEIVATTYRSGLYTSAGALVILSGDGGAVELLADSIGGYAPAGSGGVALGDLDADGTPEIVVISADSRVLALHADGSLVWASDSYSGDLSVMSYPAIADLDGDGLAEVVAGRVILDHAGALRGIGGGGWGGNYGIPVVADLDLDGRQEVITGNAAYDADGNTLWTNSLADGWCAVGDFDDDGLGEVVTVHDGEIYLLDTDGQPVWGPGEVPGGGGGPPTVADFDGDGEPEVGVAGYSGYVVYDTDGALLWQADTTDQSSARTGSSVFDFEGDGQWEVVYADELVLWVYDGATGAPLMAESGHSSWTLFEYPVIVDVDADDQAEIVLASNDSINAGWQGITVIGDAGGTWAPTTPTWNQHAYHITNVEDDLSIPAAPVMNWLVGHNSYRAGGLRETPGIPAPNLRVEVPEACWTCGEDAGAVDLVVRVSNTGYADVDGQVDVSVYARLVNGDIDLLGTTALAAPPAGTASPGLTLHYDTDPVDWIEELLVRVDDPGTVGAGPTDGAVEECDESDNEAVLTPEGCG